MTTVAAERANSIELSRTTDQLSIGDTASLKRTFESADPRTWASATGEDVAGGEGGLGFVAATLSGLASQTPGWSNATRCQKLRSSPQLFRKNFRRHTRNPNPLQNIHLRLRSRTLGRPFGWNFKFLVS